MMFTTNFFKMTVAKRDNPEVREIAKKTKKWRE